MIYPYNWEFPEGMSKHYSDQLQITIFFRNPVLRCPWPDCQSSLTKFHNHHAEWQFRAFKKGTRVSTGYGPWVTLHPTCCNRNGTMTHVSAELGSTSVGNKGCIWEYMRMCEFMRMLWLAYACMFFSVESFSTPSFARHAMHFSAVGSRRGHELIEPKQCAFWPGAVSRWLRISGTRSCQRLHGNVKGSWPRSRLELLAWSVSTFGCQHLDALA